MKWLIALFRRRTKGISKPYDCHLCYDSGVVRLPTGNKHFMGYDVFRECPNKCRLTSYGRMKIGGTS